MVAEDDKFTMQAVDPGSVCILQSVWHKDGLASFACASSDVISLSTKSLKMAAKAIKDDEQVALDMMTLSDKCRIVAQAAHDATRIVDYVIPCLEVSVDRGWIALPDEHPYVAIITLPSRPLVEQVRL